jgi:flagellar biosynthesis protein
MKRQPDKPAPDQRGRPKPNRESYPRPRRSPSRAPADGRARAVALTYNREEMPAPKVSATGQGEIAERIIALAKEHGVPIRQDPDLVALLAQLDPGQVIPPELYMVVAEVLAFVYRVKGKQLSETSGN